MANKTHYHPMAQMDAPRRVAMCGAITYHSNTNQKYIIESSDIALVTCKTCIKEFNLAQ